jgi:hypothetical protein
MGWRKPRLCLRFSDLFVTKSKAAGFKGLAAFFLNIPLHIQICQELLPGNFTLL